MSGTGPGGGTGTQGGRESQMSAKGNLSGLTGVTTAGQAAPPVGNVSSGFASEGMGLGEGAVGQGGPNRLTSGASIQQAFLTPDSQALLTPKPTAPKITAAATPVTVAEKSPLYDNAAILAAEKRNLRQRKRPLLAQTDATASTLGSSGSIFNRKDYGATI